MFLHTHPYEPFLFEGATKLIVGTLPPPRFTTGDLKEGDVNFCYGSRDGQLWPILDRIFGLDLDFETTERAIRQRMGFLREQRIGICDIVQSAERSKIDASDLGMENIVLRDMLGYLEHCPKVDTILFTGGNSKNGPEFLFRKYLKEHGIGLKLISNRVPRVHRFVLPALKLDISRNTMQRTNLHQQRTIKTVSLTAPFGAANRAVGSLETYKMMKKENPEFNTVDFRVLQYQEFF
ncbi:MAG: uracil-DNA glycosylase family protein [Flavobacteriaceae bacterium]